MKTFGAGEPERHANCPDENRRCQHGDDLNCRALGPEFLAAWDAIAYLKGAVDRLDKKSVRAIEYLERLNPIDKRHSD